MGLTALVKRFVLNSRKNQTVGFVVLRDVVFAFGIRRWRLHSCRKDIPRATLSESISSLHRSLAEDHKEFAAIAATLSSKIGLEEIVKTAPRRISTLTIIPDGPLHIVPFCALPLPGAAREYLVQRYAINIDNITSRRTRPALGALRGVFACYRGTQDRLREAVAAMLEAMTWLGAVEGHYSDKPALLAALSGASMFYFFGHGECARNRYRPYRHRHQHD